MPDLQVLESTGSPTQLERLAEDYLAHCRARGLSPKTVRDSYGYAIKSMFLPWAAQQGLSEPSQLTTRVLDGFSTHLLEHGGKRGPLSRHSIASFVESVNWWLRWLDAEGKLKKPAKAAVPKRPTHVIDVLSREEIQAMEDAAKNERDKLIVRILADTGLRANELLTLRVNDVVEVERNHYLRVKGKGNKERLVPVPRLYRRIERYAQRARPTDTISERLFLASRRSARTGEYEPLTKSGLEQMVRNLAEVAGIRKRVYPHLLRHSYATWALNRGMNPIMLAQLLGHSSLVMVQRTYAHHTAADTYELLAKLLGAD